ncbi:MAG: sigma-70 family RNA polymerase sigma factor [Marinilabiliales bacterium]|nr:MAG: sigma-70 family RNA polymerase sigma factor [Marinilabiliales bacterium]
MVEEQDFIETLEANKGIIHNICRLYCEDKDDRMDLYQEIVTRLWKVRHTFRGESKISTWIYRVALNLAISDLRKKKREPARIDGDTEITEIPDEDQGYIHEDIKLLYKAIESLSKVERAMILLNLDKQPYEEIAGIMGIKPNHARVKMHRIKEKLKTIFNNLGYG